jgi:hypothetical protein
MSHLKIIANLISWDMRSPGFYAACSGKSLLTFQNNQSVLSWLFIWPQDFDLFKKILEKIFVWNCTPSFNIIRTGQDELIIFWQFLSSVNFCRSGSDQGLPLLHLPHTHTLTLPYRLFPRFMSTACAVWCTAFVCPCIQHWFSVMTLEVSTDSNLGREGCTITYQYSWRVASCCAACIPQEHSTPSNTTLSFFTHCWICTEYQNFPSTFLYCLVLPAWLARTLYATEHHKCTLCLTVSILLWLTAEAQHNVSNQCCCLLGKLQALTCTYVKRKVLKCKAYIAHWLQQQHNHKPPIWSW